MGFDLDVCRVHAPSGELVADGFVREHDDDVLVVEAEHFTGAWLDEGDAVTVQVLSSQRGELQYDAVVAESGPRRVVVTHLRLREAVQKRGAARVPTTLRFRTTRVVLPDEEEPRAEQLDVVVADVSAGGMRVVCDEELPAGTLLELDFVAGDLRLPVRLRVLRSTTHQTTVVHGCRLEDLDERSEDALFGFVLAEQRRQRAARLDAL